MQGTGTVPGLQMRRRRARLLGGTILLISKVRRCVAPLPFFVRTTVYCIAFVALTYGLDFGVGVGDVVEPLSWWTLIMARMWTCVASMQYSTSEANRMQTPPSIFLFTVMTPPASPSTTTVTTTIIDPL